MIIYKTTNLVNGKIYVGKDCCHNPKYLGSGTMIRRAIKKHGKDNFKKETLEICDGSNWIEREKYWIKALNSRDINVGYNICVGGQSSMEGRKHTAESKEKMSIKSMGRPGYWKGKKMSLSHRMMISKNHADMSGPKNSQYGKSWHHSEEAKKKISIASTGRIFTKERRERISRALTGKKLSMETRMKISLNHADMSGSKNPGYGITVPEERRKRISESLKGRKPTESALEKMRLNNAWRGKHLSEEHRKKMSISHLNRNSLA